MTMKELRRELATRSTAPDASVAWIALKAAYRGPFTYEGVRSWCEPGVIEARKEGGRWFLSQASLSARLARLRLSYHIRVGNVRPLVVIRIGRGLLWPRAIYRRVRRGRLYALQRNPLP